MSPDVKAFFDPATNTVSYVVKDPEGRSCAVIDSVSGFRLCQRPHGYTLCRQDHRPHPR